MIKLVLSAMLAAAAGAAGTYAVVHVTATCESTQTQKSKARDGMTDFLAKPYQPMTGYPTYK
jgi:hypothetical protein